MVRAARTRCWTLLTKVLNINGLRATQACCISTRSSWRIIHITDVNHHLFPEVYYWFIFGLFRWPIHTSTPWFSRKSLTIRDGLYGAEHYLGPGQDFRGRWLLSRVRDFVAAHFFTLDCSWCRPAHPAYFLPVYTMTDGPIFPSVPCTQTSRGLSPCRLRTGARPSVWCYLNLDSSVKLQCRQWQMSKRNDVLSIDGGTDDSPKSAQSIVPQNDIPQQEDAIG